MTDTKAATAEAIDALANLLKMPMLKSFDFSFSVDADNVPIVKYTVGQYVVAQGGRGMSEATYEQVLEYCRKRCLVLMDREFFEHLKRWPADMVQVVRCKDCAIPHNRWTGCPRNCGADMREGE